MKKELFLFWGSSISVDHIEHKAQGEMVILETNNISMIGEIHRITDEDLFGRPKYAYYRDIWLIGCTEPMRFASLKQEDLRV